MQANLVPIQEKDITSIADAMSEMESSPNEKRSAMSCSIFPNWKKAKCELGDEEIASYKGIMSGTKSQSTMGAGRRTLKVSIAIWKRREASDPFRCCASHDKTFKKSNVQKFGHLLLEENELADTMAAASLTTFIFFALASSSSKSVSTLHEDAIHHNES